MTRAAAGTLRCGGEVVMAAPIAVFALGVGIGALGLVEADMYVVGLVVMSVGGVGVLVRLGYWWLDRRSLSTGGQQ